MADRILLAHGGGGRLTHELIEELILPALGASGRLLADAAPIPQGGGLLMTTDAFVVQPIFFQGGNIGSLAVHGTVNDLAVSGAEPLALTVALVIEEGLEKETLQTILASLGHAAREAGVEVIAGDTKVVPRGDVDQIFITTTGVGRQRIDVRPDRVAEGDQLILSGPIAAHGVAIMSAREGLTFGTRVESDSASVWPMVRALIEARIDLHTMRDPTRGGLAATCVELAMASRVSIELDEVAIPVAPEVAAACDMLGLDPLAVANEGKLLAIVAADEAEHALSVLRGLPEGSKAAVVGKAVASRARPVYLRTHLGGERIVEMPYGEALPRIC